MGYFDKATDPGYLAVMKGGPQNEFSLQLFHGGIDVKFNGDINIIIQMLFQAMENQDPIAKTVITTVLIFADQKGIALSDLKKHSYIQDEKIVAPKT